MVRRVHQRIFDIEHLTSNFKELLQMSKEKMTIMKIIFVLCFTVCVGSTLDSEGSFVKDGFQSVTLLINEKEVFSAKLTRANILDTIFALLVFFMRE